MTPSLFVQQVVFSLFRRTEYKVPISIITRTSLPGSCLYFVSLSPSVCFSLCLSVSVPFCLSVSVSVSLCLSVCLTVCLSRTEVVQLLTNYYHVSLSLKRLHSSFLHFRCTSQHHCCFFASMNGSILHLATPSFSFLNIKNQVSHLVQFYKLL